MVSVSLLSDKEILHVGRAYRRSDRNVCSKKRQRHLASSQHVTTGYRVWPEVYPLAPLQLSTMHLRR